jgi:hypothetical protein
VVSAPGRLPTTRAVELRAGGATEVVVTLEPEAVAEAPRTRTAPRPPTEPKAAPRAATPATHEAPPPAHPGRPAKIIAVVAAAAAVVAGAVAIYTWRTYVGLQDDAHRDLTGIAAQVPTTPELSAFYKSPSCSPPQGLNNAPGVERYRTDCHNGESYATATTALWIVAGALATAGVVSFVVGDRMDAKAKEAHSAGRLIRQTLRLTPVFGTQGGGLTGSFEF